MHILTHLVTTTKAGKLKPTGTPDEYKLKIWVGGAKDEGPATEKAIKEIEKFMAANGYAYYTIVKRQYSWLPSAYQYTVQFRRG